MNPCTPSAGSAADIALVPQQVLEDGEVVILTLKPSLWLIPLSCWPVAAVAAAGAVVVNLARPSGSESIVYALCLGAVALKTGLATLNWLGRLYVLTNRRVLTIRGVWRCEVGHCLLEHLREIRAAAAFDERLVRVGSLAFLSSSRATVETSWDHVSRPEGLRQDILDAVAHYRP